MSLFDFFPPDAAQAGQVARLAGASEWANRLREQEAGTLAARNRQLRLKVARLEQDAGALALVIASILKSLDQKGQVSRDEVKENIRKLDLLDKARDGRISVEDLGGGDFFDAPRRAPVRQTVLTPKRLERSNDYWTPQGD